MVFSGVEKNIYNSGTIRPQFGKYTAKQPVTPPVKAPEIKDTFTKTKKPSNDGKFSFLEFGKNIAKGTGQFFGDIYKSIVNHPLIATGIIAAGAAVAATPIGLTMLTGFGLITAAFGGVFAGVKAASNIIKGKWDELEKQGNTFGKLLTGGVLSAVGAVSGIKQLHKMAGIKSNISTGKAVKKAMNLSIFTDTVLKDAVVAPFRVFNKLVRKKPDESGIFLGVIKNNWTKFVNGNAEIKDGKFLTKVTNFLFRPNLNQKTFEAAEKTALLNAAKKPIGHKGFIDFKFGLGKDGTVRNFGQAVIQALRGRGD